MSPIFLPLWKNSPHVIYDSRRSGRGLPTRMSHMPPPAWKKNYQPPARKIMLTAAAANTNVPCFFRPPVKKCPPWYLWLRRWLTRGVHKRATIIVWKFTVETLCARDLFAVAKFLAEHVAWRVSRLHVPFPIYFCVCLVPACAVGLTSVIYWTLRPVYSDTAQLNSTSSWVELRRRSVYSDADVTTQLRS